MRCSGWSNDVDSIASSNNLVYVPDAAHSAVAEWVLTSGLTFEEAALIQPGYSWPAGQYDASAYEPGESVLEKDGLRYSNFRLQAQNYIVSAPGMVVPIDDGAKPTLSGLGLSAGKGTYSPFPFPAHVPVGTHWIAIGGTNWQVQSPLHSLNASAFGGFGQMVVVSFDVAPIAADQRINGISESSYAYWQGFQNLNATGTFDPPASAIYYLKTTALDGATSLASLNLDQSSPGSGYIRKSDTQSFAAAQQLSVESRLWLQDGVRMDTYVLDFNVVTLPDPAGGFMAAAVVLGVCGVKRRRS
jgi:hypothetical protein